MENPLLGAWRLKSITGSVPKAAIFSMGAKPQGILIYTATGHMAAEIMRDPRPAFHAGYENASAEEIRNAFEGYYAYFGTYHVNVREMTVTHHLEGSLRPAEIGRDYVRTYKLLGDQLTLNPVREGRKLQVRLTWERAK
ncbi:MAG: lipocalin-like domain-containing protein [Candidatus Acidiferrales bacterium]